MNRIIELIMLCRAAADFQGACFHFFEQEGDFSYSSCNQSDDTCHTDGNTLFSSTASLTATSEAHYGYLRIYHKQRSIA